MHGGQHWIAKLQERGDAPNSPLREYLAMRSERACGVDAATVEFCRAGPHQVVVVKRFDRDHQVLRHGFASARTLLRLDSIATPGDPLRSYPYLATEIQRWCGAEGADVPGLCAGGRWSLSPAYDIAPTIAFGGFLAMSSSRDGHMQAARWALLRDCETFGCNEDECGRWIDQATLAMKQAWEAERAALGFGQDDAPTPTPAQWLEAEPPDNLAPKRRPRARRRDST